MFYFCCLYGIIVTHFELTKSILTVSTQFLRLEAIKLYDINILEDLSYSTLIIYEEYHYRIIFFHMMIILNSFLNKEISYSVVKVALLVIVFSNYAFLENTTLKIHYFKFKYSFIEILVCCDNY